MTARFSIRPEASAGLIGAVLMMVRNALAKRPGPRPLTDELASLRDDLLDDIGMKRSASGAVLPLWAPSVPPQARRSAPLLPAGAPNVTPTVLPIPVPPCQPTAGSA